MMIDCCGFFIWSDVDGDSMFFWGDSDPYKISGQWCMTAGSVLLYCK